VGASLEQDLTETRDRFCFPDAAKALKRCNRQHKVHEQTGAKRDKQKDTETPKFAIRCHDKTKLPENRRAHKGFSCARPIAAAPILRGLCKNLPRDC